MSRPLHLTDHAAARAWERLGLGAAEAVPDLAWKVVTAARRHAARGRAIPDEGDARYACGVVWVVIGRWVVTVYVVDRPGIRALLDRSVGT